MDKKKILIVALILIVCIYVFYRADMKGFIAQSQDIKSHQVKVRVGYFPNLTHLQAVVGISDGTFEKHLGNGVLIEKRVFNAGPAEMEAFMANELDIGYIGPVPAINGYSKTNGKIKIVAGSCNNGSSLIVTNDSQIKSIIDLNGKKVAVPQYGNTQDILLRKIVSENNLKSVDKGGNVTIIQSENANIITLLERKLIDAAFIPEPWATTAIKKLNANVLLESNEIFGGNDYSTTVVIVNNDFAKAHPEIVQKFLDAHSELTQEINNNKQLYSEKFIDEILRLTGVKLQLEIIKQSLNNMNFSTDIPASSLQSYMDYLYDSKYINYKYDSNDLVDTRYIKK